MSRLIAHRLGTSVVHVISPAESHVASSHFFLNRDRSCRISARRVTAMRAPASVSIRTRASFAAGTAFGITIVLAAAWAGVAVVELSLSVEDAVTYRPYVCPPFTADPSGRVTHDDMIGWEPDVLLDRIAWFSTQLTAAFDVARPELIPTDSAQWHALARHASALGMLVLDEHLGRIARELERGPAEDVARLLSSGGRTPYSLSSVRAAAAELTAFITNSEGACADRTPERLVTDRTQAAARAACAVYVKTFDPPYVGASAQLSYGQRGRFAP